MSFYDSAVFPENYSYGTSGGPGHSTAITEGASGTEVRVQRYAAARNRYSVRNVTKKPEDAAAIISFVRVVEGAAHGFRFKDPLDWSTGRYHQYVPSTDIRDRLPIQQGGDGTSVNFQLSRPYNAGGVQKWRTITRPMYTGYETVTYNGREQVSNYIWVGSNPEPLSEGSEWTLDTSSGVVTFASPPANGATIYWSGAYHTPVRFGQGVDEALSGSIDQGGVTSFEELDLVELVDTLEGSEVWDPGGASIAAFSSDWDASLAYGVHQILQPNGPGISAILRNFNNLRLGTLMEFLNDSAHDLTFRLHDNTVLFTLAAGDQIRIKVSGNNGVAAGWFST